jgi:hypothetical protein
VKSTELDDPCSVYLTLMEPAPDIFFNLKRGEALVMVRLGSTGSFYWAVEGGASDTFALGSTSNEP